MRTAHVRVNLRGRRTTDDGRLLGYDSAGTRLRALEQADLSGDHAGEVLGRSGI